MLMLHCKKVKKLFCIATGTDGANTASGRRAGGRAGKGGMLAGR
jgi:hypothetical protein